MGSDIYLTEYRDPYDGTLKGNLFIRAESQDEAEEIADSIEFRSGAGANERVEGVVVNGQLVSQYDEDGNLIADYENGEIGPAF